MELRTVVKEKKFWIASLLVVWAAALQGHVMWIQRQDAFKQKFGDPDTSTSKQGEQDHVLE